MTNEPTTGSPAVRPSPRGRTMAMQSLGNRIVRGLLRTPLVSRLAGAVVALEENPVLAEAAQNTLRRLDFATVTLAIGRLVAGWPTAAPFDVIVIEGGVEAMPDTLFAQLSEGGRLVTVMYGGAGDGPGEGPVQARVGKATLFRSVRGEVGGRPLFDCAAPLLPGFEKAPAFVF